MKKLAVLVSILVLVCGCGGGPNVQLVTISFNQPPYPVVGKGQYYPITQPYPNIDQGQTLPISVSLLDDDTHAGVTFTATGPGCVAATCGTFSNVTTTSAIYTAPATVSSQLSITITATSVAQPTQSVSTSFSVMPPPTIIYNPLPNAEPSYVYSSILSATGGVQPLSWSLASGTLPPGISLNTAGALYGTPTAGGTFSFTVQVTDSSGAVAGGLSAKQAYSMIVAAVLTVPAATFPNATDDQPYSATLVADGGLAPLVWKLYLGSLPLGLVLQGNTGVISGTPIAQGTYTFQVEVFDSSPVAQYYISPVFTIVVNPSGPLTLSSTSLLNGADNVQYEGTLAATGGNAPFTWSISSGALPAALTLNSSTGVISGVPTAAPGTYGFTATVTDSSTPQQTSSAPLSITLGPQPAACPSTGNNSALDGEYVFTLRGYNGTGLTGDQADGTGYISVVGSFTADGAGDIIAGEADTNGVLGAQYGGLIVSASSYSVGPDNRGCATLATPFGTFVTRFALGALSVGVATQGRVIEFDPPGPSAFIASGQILQQNTTNFVTPFTGAYSLKTSGWDPSVSLSPPAPLAHPRVVCAGLLTGNRFQFGLLEEDCNENGDVTNTTQEFTLTGNIVNTFTAADNDGRLTGIMLVNGSLVNVRLYWVSTAQLVMINADSYPEFSGDLEQEAAPSGTSGFSNASLYNTVASYLTGLELPASGTAFGDVSLATESADGVNSITVQLYRDEEGVWLPPVPQTSVCNYTVVLLGRMTLGSACGASTPISYFESLNTAFEVGTDPAMELGQFEPQTTGLTAASLAGTYFIGTSEVVSQSDEAEVGVITLTAAGALTSTTDSTSTSSQAAGAAGSDTLALNANGTFSTASSSGSVVGIAISGSKIVMVANPTSVFPTLLVAQH